MNKKAHILISISVCAFLSCSCTPKVDQKPDVEKKCNHTFSLVKAKEPSFYEDGNIEYYLCKKCKKTFDKDKKDISLESTVKKIDLFNKLDVSEPQMMFGKDISLKYKSEDTKDILDEGKALVNKISTGRYTAIEANNYIVKLNKRLSFTEEEYYKARILADAYAGQEDYEIKNAIYNDYYDLQDQYWATYVAIAKEGSYNDKFFKGKTQKEIDDFIKKHSPSTGQSTGQSEPSTSRKIENLLSDYAAGKIERYEAFSGYVALANTLAKENSYASYIEYAYKLNDREYTKEDSLILSNYVLEYISPLANELREKYEEVSSDKEIAKGVNALKTNFFGKNMDYLRDYALNLGGTYKSDFQNLFEAGDYFFSNIDNPNAGGYTANVPVFGRFIFLGRNYQSINTLIHEFGHYHSENSFGVTSSLDLAETQSRGNEYLFLSYFKNSSMEKKLAQAYTYERVIHLLNTVLLGCAINELEMFAYQNSFNQETLEQKWSDLLVKYGATLGRNKLEYLYEVILNFNVYYISYAVSGIAVLEMFQKTYNNFDKAKTAYESICTKDSSDEKFLKSLENAQLPNVFSKEAFETIALLNNI